MLSSRIASTLCLALFLAACDPSESTPDPITDDSGPDAGTPDAGPTGQDAGEVVVTRDVRYLTAAGESVRAEALASPIEVLVPTASGYTRLSGSELSPGRASVPGVPATGDVLVRTGTAYVYTSGRSVQRGLVAANRPDVAFADSGAEVNRASLNVTGLEPWNATQVSPWVDSLQLLAQELGAVSDVSPDEGPVTGTTSFSAVSTSIDNLMGPYFPRLGGTETLTLTQRTSRDAGMVNGSAMSYVAARRAATFGAPVYDGSTPLAVNAALQDLVQHPFTFDLRSSQFAAQRALVHPDATILNMLLEVVPAAYGLGKYGWVGYSGELLTYVQTTTKVADHAATFSYGDPHPASWGRVVRADGIFRVSYTLPSGARYNLSRYIGSTDSLQGLLSAPIQPALLPPAGLQVDATAAQAARTLASRTPVLSWSAPPAGVPTAYILYVFRLTDNGSSSAVQRSTASLFYLPASVRSLRLPEGVLESGGHYVFALTAVRAPNWDITREDTRQTLPFHEADTLSGLMTAP